MLREYKHKELYKSSRKEDFQFLKPGDERYDPKIDFLDVSKFQYLSMVNNNDGRSMVFDDILDQLDIGDEFSSFKEFNVARQKQMQCELLFDIKPKGFRSFLKEQVKEKKLYHRRLAADQRGSIFGAISGFVSGFFRPRN